jgi:hypothetical protein
MGEFMTTTKKRHPWKSRSEWVEEQKKNRPKFTKTETIEEFLARGNEIKKCELGFAVEPTENSKYSHKDKRGDWHELNSILPAKSKHKMIEEVVSKRVKRKKEQEGEA